ncbi:hypothetical protein JCM17092_25490 [Haloplanus litoreus]
MSARSPCVRSARTCWNGVSVGRVHAVASVVFGSVGVSVVPDNILSDWLLLFIGIHPIPFSEALSSLTLYTD